jgi:hypothetical protein
MPNQQHVPLWEFVPLTDYAPPAPDVMETTKHRVAMVWRQLRPNVEPPLTEPMMAAEALAQLPAWQMRRAAPAPDWGAAADALGEALAPWQAARRGERLGSAARAQAVRLVVTPPHVDRAAFMAAWAEQEAWRVVPTPTAAQVLEGGGTWMTEQFDGGAGPWVLPELERLYLRHAAGLDLIRSFLDRAHAGELGQGLIGCDSWAWAFVKHVWRGWLPPALTPQAFDEVRLRHLFRSLAGAHGGRRLRFRQADDGHDILPPPDGEGESSAPDAPNTLSPFLHELAAYSRGNLGVAWAIWRTALQTEPNEEMAEKEGDDDPRIIGQTVWVKPWDEVVHPTLPTRAGRDAAFVLHALLLHAGLPATTLAHLLPLTPSEITATLDLLWAAGVVEEVDARWRVSAVGMPAARDFLRSGNYLIDAHGEG